MAVGGLVLSLAREPAAQAAVRAWLEADARIEVGPTAGRRLALVATTETLGEGHALCEALLALPGVENLEVAYVAPEEERATAALQGDV